jgi:hypothetical protein
MQVRNISLNVSDNIMPGRYLPGEINVAECDATDGSFAFNLPDVSALIDIVFYIIKLDSSANTVTVNFVNNQSASGQTSIILSTQWQSVCLVRAISNNYLKVG